MIALEVGWCPFGGWAPYRSGVVNWGNPCFGHEVNTFYYRCADEGHFDLVCWPKHSKICLEQANTWMVELFDKFEELVIATA